MVTYHYVKFYVSIIIHLEVININVRNFNFPIGFSVAIFKMAATIPHKFNIVRFQRPELIPDIEKFLPVSILKMAATIPQKFNILRFQR
jgi:hypothetical protein